MKITQLSRFLIILTIAIMVVGVPLLIPGCNQSITGAAATELAATMVPAVDLDVYICVNQQVPTIVPQSLTGAPSDISVQSLAIWGMVNSESEYTISGALTCTSVADASAAFAQIPNLANIYVKLSDRTIYFVHGSGAPAATMRTAIDNNNFEHYDDVTALAAVSKLPSGGTTNPGLIGVIKPNNAAINLVKQYLDQNTANAVSSVFSGIKPRIIALGVFSPQPLN